MKLTLLEMTQMILSGLDSDEVNSISDTTESLQVANTIRESYLHLVEKLDLPETKSVVQLDPSLDVSKPTLMYLPDNYENLEWLKYNRVDSDGSENWLAVDYQPFDRFVESMHTRASGNGTNLISYTLTANGSTFTVYSDNDAQPRFFTTVDDHTILFDSYDAALDATLQSAKTMGMATYSYAFTMSDTFVPHLDSNQFMLLFNEAKSQAFVDLKQASNPRSEARARDHLIRARDKKSDMPKQYYGSAYDNLPDYGRKGSTVVRGSVLNRQTRNGP